MHLTTAIFLLFLGAHLEYLRYSDFYILFLIITVCFFKIIAGGLLVNLSDDLSLWHQKEKSINIYIWFWIRFEQYSPLPLETFFAIYDSIKYIQFVYLAKWIERKHVMTVIGFYYINYGMIIAITNTLNYYIQTDCILRDILFPDDEGVVTIN